MKSKNLWLTLGTLVITTLILLTSCKKVNDATTIGGDLIPVVDNITTFDTTLEVESYNGIYGLTPPDYDSLRGRNSDIYFMGNITNDPLFGTTSGTIFSQFKPASFRFAFPFSKPDSLIGLDSVVLVLKYVNTFGDTTMPQTVNVFEIDQTANFKYDSFYLVRQNDVTYSAILGSGMYTPKDLNDSVHVFEEDASNQLRIKLNDVFGQRLLAYDSATVGNNAYAGDSIFNTFFKGFAIVPGGTGNALLGIDIASSKLSIYYKYKHGVLDTAVTNFGFTAGSASSYYVQRDYSGSQLLTYQGAGPQEFAFIQAQPGTYTTINIPGLKTLSNRIIHRADLIVKEAYNDPLDDILTPPTYLYVDAYDTAKSFSRAIPYDISLPDQSTGSLVTANPLYGFSAKNAVGGAGVVNEWKFNLSRYVQNILTGKATVYPLRLYAPYIARDYFDIGGGTDYLSPGYVNPTSTDGRVRVYGGDATGANPDRMRLRIIYSKI